MTDNGRKKGSFLKNSCIRIVLVICAFGMLLAITLQYPTLAFHDEYLSYSTGIDKIDKIPADENAVLFDPVVVKIPPGIDKIPADENAVLFDPVVVESRCGTTKRKRVIDFTMINNELSTLELRLNELWNVVDVFYIMETTVRFRPGMPPKPLALTDNWDYFKKFHSKIVLEVLPPEASQGAANTTFGINELQRSVHWNLLKEKIKPSLNPDDLIIYSDLDELPRPDEIEKLACEVNLPRTPICLETKDSFFYYNYLCRIKFEWTVRPKILHYTDGYQKRCVTTIKNGSTHCSSCFATIEEYQTKANSNSEPIRDPMVTDRDSILKRVRGCKDFWRRDSLDRTMQLRETIDPESVPLTVRRHPDRWPHYLGKLYEDTIPNQHDT
jgi:beta-1,4-mannosyl-glycoprotein beta-1,4-N-acetylglucosaminyltransferase